MVSIQRNVMNIVSWSYVLVRVCVCVCVRACVCARIF